jgi:hypothetical protein
MSLIKTNAIFPKKKYKFLGERKKKLPKNVKFLINENYMYSVYDRTQKPLSMNFFRVLIVECIRINTYSWRNTIRHEADYGF